MSDSARIGIVTAIEHITDIATGERQTLIRCDLGGGEIVSAEYYQDAGDDSLPEPGDFVALSSSVASGTWHVTGTLDPKNQGIAEPGEKRIYSRDGEGTLVAHVYLRGDGVIVVEALASGAPIEIRTTGTVVLDAPDVRLSDAAGAAVARVGDLVSVVVPELVAGGIPVTPVIPTQAIPTGGYIAAGQIISGQPKVKA
jgi:hypothetical protein